MSALAMAELYAPKEYWEIPERIRNLRPTACGAGKGIGDAIIPDKIWGLDITEACRIHDFMYSQGRTEEDRLEADRVLLNNILRLIEADLKASSIPFWRAAVASARRYRAMTYYNAVRDFGGPAFWKGKNPREELGNIAVL